MALEAKLEQAIGTFGPEVERLARELGASAEANFGDLVRNRRADSPSFIDGLAPALSSLPVYRTYVDACAGRVAEEDRRALEGLDPEIRALLALEQPGPPEFVTRFQQTTPAIMAKGVEDTAFYRYGRLLALNDVGGDPSRFGIDVERFHMGCQERARRFPQNLLTTMTHDAKRSADVRARIAVLSWMPQEWRRQVERWFEITETFRAGGSPDDVERYFIFQTLVGAWPIERERLSAYMEKALREAKRNTSWVEQNHEYEHAVLRFCEALYTSETFRQEFEPFVRDLDGPGERAALGQLVLKLTAPGIPDIYQGDELPYRALVDPDNRRPVDWGWRRAMLRRVMGGSPPVHETRKLFVILRLLGLRARRPQLFATGSYEPVATGASGCTFLRGEDLLVAIALPRAQLGDADAAVAAPGGRWRDVLRGEERTFATSEPLVQLVGRWGLAVFERIAR